MTRKCLDLFAGLGGFSAAFRDSEAWEVTTVEIDPEFEPDIQADVMDLRPSDFEQDFDVILAGHPCTYFTAIRRTTTGGDDAWDGYDPQTPECRDHVAMVYHTLGLIQGLNPDWWFVENPRATLRKVWREPECTVWYCQYGSDHPKPTDLWGDHPPSFEPLTCAYGNDACDHVKSGSYAEGSDASSERQGVLSDSDSAERSKVPYELSTAILNAVESPEPDTRQLRIGEAA